ncbi:MAG: peptide-methionine (S)-S-oxide reductase MsrA [Alphaproteobacteria bacterium]|nr:peptide-methionine (S)-S-oxide reductase MsrA [Alphaproteobacteria bacterium]
MAEATFAAGCFWGVEEAFRKVPGVTDASVGYTGGATQTPTYEQICSGTTGHAEAIHIVFDETQVSFEDLLGVFFQIHDPRQVNRQGPDVGTQYRSAIFFHDASQETAARTVKQTVDEALPAGDPVATEIVPAATFWPAEDYHQQYVAKQRGGGLLGRLMGD